MNTFFHWLAPAGALSIALLSTALAADPTDAKAPAQPLRYQSAFGDYKPWRDIKPGSWRELNESVAPAPGKTGGHAGHTPAAQPAAPKASAPAAPAHHGHRMHGGKR